MKKRVLCLLVDGFEEIEAVTPIDLLRRADVEVVIASMGGGTVVGRSGIRIEADLLLSEVDASDFDMLFLPGGPGVGEMRKDGRPAKLARDFNGAGKDIAAICAAALVLMDAGLLAGRRYTAHFSAREELGTAMDERVVSDGNVITSRGAGTALEFGLALVERLAGTTQSLGISAAIMA